MVEKEVENFLLKICGVDYNAMSFGVAVSGGLDSMVLLSVMNNLKLKVCALHINFQLRDNESNEDELFVKNFADSRAICSEIKRFDTNQIAEQEKKSMQLVARNLRYEWFEKNRKEKNLDFILTAHHQQDVIETFLLTFQEVLVFKV